MTFADGYNLRNPSTAKLNDIADAIDALYSGSGGGGGGGFIWVGTTTGSANTYAATPSPALTTYASGTRVMLRVNASNTGASTLNLNGLGAKNIRKGNGGAALSAGDLPINSYAQLIYESDNGGQFRLLDVWPNTANTWINAAWFGTDGSAIQTALNLGRNVFVPAGTWDCATELLISNDYQQLRFNGATLRPGVNSMTVIHLSASYAHITGSCKIDNNSKTGCSAIRITPADETQVITRVDQNFNVIDGNIHITGSFDEGIVLKTGPDVAGADSGCWYNRIYNVHVQGAKRAVWLRNGPNASSSGNNRNTFIGCRFGQTSMNTGVHIESGDTNKFINCSFEGINSGTSPSATPTAVRVAASGTYSGDNNSNSFHACNFEGCTRDVDNANAYTGLFDCNYLTRLFTATPRFSSGYDLANVPQVNTEWMIMQSNGQISGNINGINWRGNHALHSNVEIADYASSTHYTWQNHTLTTSNVTNVTSFSGHASKYNRANNMCEWHFRMGIRATVAGTVIRINLPLTPDSTTYRNNSTVGPMRFPVVTSNGSGTQVVVSAQLSDHTVGTPYLEIPVPAGNWDTGGTNNQIHGQIRFHV